MPERRVSTCFSSAFEIITSAVELFDISAFVEDAKHLSKQRRSEQGGHGFWTVSHDLRCVKELVSVQPDSSETVTRGHGSDSAVVLYQFYTRRSSNVC